MAKHFTLDDLRNSPAGKRNLHLFEEAKKPKSKRAKYSSQRVEYKGIWFDSIKERKRYIELEFLQQQGVISHLELQVPYELNEDGTFSYKYIADFEYIDTKSGQKITEDAKGCRTAVYKKKAKLMLKIHGITIKET